MSNKECDATARALQKSVFAKLYPGRAVNSFRPAKASSRITLPNGTEYVNDICYGTEYPNSYLDIWYSPLREQHSCPTYVYLHGGGISSATRSRAIRWQQKRSRITRISKISRRAVFMW